MYFRGMTEAEVTYKSKAKLSPEQLSEGTIVLNHMRLNSSVNSLKYIALARHRMIRGFREQQI